MARTARAITQAHEEAAPVYGSAEEAEAHAAELVTRKVMGDTITLHRGEVEATVLANELAGKMRHADLIETASRLSVLYDLERIKQSQGYRGACVRHAKTEEVVTTNTWEEYCDALGRSRKIIDEDLKNLAVFGGNLIRIQDSLGIGYRELRKIRAGLLELPPGEQQAKLMELSGAEDKEEALGMVGELEVKLAAAENARKEMEETIANKDSLLQKAAKARDAAELKLEKLLNVKESEPEKFRAEKEKTARKELAEVISLAIGQVGAVAILARGIFMDEGITPEFAEYVNEEVAVMCKTFRNQLLAAAIEVDLAAYLGVGEETPY